MVITSDRGSIVCSTGSRSRQRRAAFALLLLIAPSGIARADGSLDFYGGWTLHRSVDVSVSETSASGTTSASESIDPATTGELGARLQGWFPSHPWLGLGMDVGYFRAEEPGVVIDAYPLAFSLLLRAPLFASHNRPDGILQPYAMAGIAFYMADVSVDLEGLEASAFQMGWPLPGAGFDLITGPYLAAGLAWQPASRFALFGEYRYTSFDVGFDTTNSPILPTMNGRVDTSLTTDHLLVGISYRFPEGSGSK